jgi:hypothetical protein
MNDGLSVSDVVATLRRIDEQQARAADEEQKLHAALTIDIASIEQRRQTELREIDRHGDALDAIRRGAESDLRKFGFNQTDALLAATFDDNSAVTISDLLLLVKRTAKNAKELDSVLRASDREKTLEANALAGLEELARRKALPSPLSVARTPAPEPISQQPKAETTSAGKLVTTPATPVVISSKHPSITVQPQQRSYQTVIKILFLSAVVLLIMASILYFILSLKS